MKLCEKCHKESKGSYCDACKAKMIVIQRKAFLRNSRIERKLLSKYD